MQMVLFIIIINAIIRILFGWGMFCAFSHGYYFFASICLIGAMKRNWIVFDTKYNRKMYINLDK